MPRRKKQEAEQPAPKRRGRPPKKKTEVNEKPKRRGRPPKKKVEVVDEKPKRKRGRPRKNPIPEPIEEKKAETPPLGLCDQWRQGQLNKFNSGDVVERKNDGSIGVIGNFIPDSYKKYRIKWHVGKPNKWDFTWGEVHEDTIKKSNAKNPIDIPSWEKYPGPSSAMIAKLQASFKKQKNESKDIDALVESMEEDRKRKRGSIKIQQAIEEEEEEVDSVVDMTLEEDTNDLGGVDGDEIYEMLKRELEDE